MKTIKLLALLWLFATPAFGQGAQQQVPNVSIPPALIDRLISFLGNGGTYTESLGLRDALIQSVQEPQREAAIQRRIDAAVAEALKAKSDSGN